MSSIEGQLKTIKSSTQAAPEPQRGPQTRPSILYDPKEAADIDHRTILPITLSGLDVLIELDERFSCYKNTLFSQASLELDREKMTQKENEKLNKSIDSYLRLLSGHLLHLAARKTLEYLIRKYLVHIYNMEELILCVLPYHDTHVFVQIVQLIKPGNSKWAFLEGVKGSGAAPPRHVIVQQCICDKGLLETICNYASANKDYNHSRPVISFCTAVTVETLGKIPKLDTETVQRVKNFVFSALNPLMKSEQDHKAGALMVIGLLGTKSTLTPKLFRSLILSIAKVAENDANNSLDLPWLRVVTMAMISLVQSQPIQDFPEKSVLILKEIRGFAGVLSELSNEYNIQRFINLYLESLLKCSTSDDSCYVSLVNIVETIPLKNSVENIANKVLDAYCAKTAGTSEISDSADIGKWAKEILAVIDKHYPSELRGAIRKFLQDNEMKVKKGKSISESVALLLDETEENSSSESNRWFLLEHPKAEVRKTAMMKISESGIIKNAAAKPHEIVNLQDAVTRGLLDKDLSIIQAALSIDGISSVFNSNSLFKALQNVLSSCMDTINKGASGASKACDVAVSCLKRIVELQSHQLHYLKDVSSTVFPLLIVRSKTWKVNLKALELIKEIKWPFFTESSFSLDPINFDDIKDIDPKSVAANNEKLIDAFSSTFISNPKEYIGWLADSGKNHNLSKSFFLLIVLRALFVNDQGFSKVMELYQTCFPYVKTEWFEMECSSDFSSLNGEKVEKYCSDLANSLFTAETEGLNCKALACIFWSFLKACSSANKFNSDANSKRESMLDDLFLFFCTAPYKSSFENHLRFLLTNCTNAPFRFLSKYFAEEGFSSEVQIESLCLYASLGTSSERSNFDENFHCQLLTGFPLLLIPLSHENKDIRTSAMNCIESLFIVCRRFNTSLFRNGSNSKVPQCLISPTFGVFLEALVDQKNMISSDAMFLSSYLSSMLSSSNHNLMVPDEIQDRFDQSAKNSMLIFFLNSVLTFSSYGKLMVLSLLKGLGNALFEIENVKLFFISLIEKRNTELDKLNTREIDILCLLLEVSLSASNASEIDTDIFDSIIRAVRVDSVSSDDAGIVRPTVTILQMVKPALFDSLNMDTQDKLFGAFVLLLRNDSAQIRNSARETLLHINISYLTMKRLIDAILSKPESPGGLVSNKRKKKDRSENFFGLFQNSSRKEESEIFVLMSLLDILLLKKDLVNRAYLVKPVFQVLAALFDDNAIQGLITQLKTENQIEKENEIIDEESISSILCQARQLTLLALKDIVDSIQMDLLQLQEELFDKGDIELLIECARSSVDASTRNHVFMLVSSVSRVSPLLVSDNIIGIFSVIGESALKQDDRHSQHVLEDLISKLIPCWLSRTTSVEELLQIFIMALSDLPEHRRLMLIVYLSRTLGEESSLGTIIYLLLSALSKKLVESSRDQENLNKLLSDTLSENWEFKLALKLCEQYSCKIWFPSLVNMLKEIHSCKGEGQFWDIFLSVRFVLDMLQDAELMFEFEAQRNSNYLQDTLAALMEKNLFLLQLAISKKKQFKIEAIVLKEFHDLVNKSLKLITRRMVPSTFFTSITRLIGDVNGNVQRKTLGILCETLREGIPTQREQKEARKSNHKPLASLFQLDDSSSHSFTDLCSKLVQLIDGTNEANSDNISIKRSSISSFELLANKYPSDIYTRSLPSITNQISSKNPVISSSAIRTTGALITVLGSKALPQLPLVMKNTVNSAMKLMEYNKMTSDGASVLKSVFVTLEIIVEKLGGFLNPYLESILGLVLLHNNEFVSELDLKLNSDASTLRRLLTEKIPVRLMLQPLLQINTKAINCGEISLSLTFEMLLSLVNTMDRAAIATYHGKIFEFCIKALDLRHEKPEIIKNVNLVENSVINALSGLTMRLTEKMFRPLFLQSLEWAEAEFDFGSKSKKSFDRAVSFYKFVNKLCEQHRSLFVPYFKYMLESCVRYLTEDLVSLKRKKKKAKSSNDIKIDNENNNHENIQALKHWHVKFLVVNALHKCFLYDCDQKILDFSNFEVLLKPIVAQLALEPPVPCTFEFNDVPAREEMDESLVQCLGQMAATARSDILWKPLNHEVLMQTRNEKLRPKILGLKVILYLVQNLKEEYIVFLPETIPFLGELLEDAELSVKSLAQEVLKEMETLSGESLRQYL